ncbi:hypothetical protein ES703_64315 [subsurface metagenome]
MTKDQLFDIMAFMTAAEFQKVRDTLETWSGLCLRQLAEMTQLRKSGAQIDAPFDNA